MLQNITSLKLPAASVIVQSFFLLKTVYYKIGLNQEALLREVISELETPSRNLVHLRRELDFNIRHTKSCEVDHYGYDPELQDAHKKQTDFTREIINIR